VYQGNSRQPRPQPVDEIVDPDALIQAFAEVGFPKVLLREPTLGGIYYRMVLSR